MGEVTPSKWAEARQAGSELSNKPVEWSGVVKDSPTQRVLFQLGFGLGTLLNDMCASCWFNFLFVFLERVQGLSGAQVGAVFLTGQLCDAVSTPLIGLLADWAQGLYVCGLGRRQVFYLLGATIVSLSFVFVFGVCLPVSWRQLRTLVCGAHCSHPHHHTHPTLPSAWPHPTAWWAAMSAPSSLQLQRVSLILAGLPPTTATSPWCQSSRQWRLSECP